MFKTESIEEKTQVFPTCVLFFPAYWEVIFTGIVQMGLYLSNERCPLLLSDIWRFFYKGFVLISFRSLCTLSDGVGMSANQRFHSIIYPNFASRNY